jgi:hypothetical protein
LFEKEAGSFPRPTLIPVNISADVSIDQAKREIFMGPLDFPELQKEQYP